MLGRGTARTISTFDMTLETSTWAPTAPPMANAVKRPATLDALRPAVVRGFEPQIRLQLSRVYGMCLKMYSTWNGWKA